MFTQLRFARTSVHRFALAVCVALFGLSLAACASSAAPAPAGPVGKQHISNGDFEQGDQDWIISQNDNADVEVIDPVVSGESASSGSNGVRFATVPGTRSISAYEQEFELAKNFDFSFRVRPIEGDNRIGLAQEGPGANITILRFVFLNAGDPDSQIVITAWDTHYALPYPLEPNQWLQIRAHVDGDTGIQSIQIGDNYSLRVQAPDASELPSAGYIVLGDRQPSADPYVISYTQAEVKAGLSGTYDFDEISLTTPE
jgi:hypothetical protein